MTARRLHVVRPPRCVTPTEELARHDTEDAAEARSSSAFVGFLIVTLFFAAGFVCGASLNFMETVDRWAMWAAR